MQLVVRLVNTAKDYSDVHLTLALNLLKAAVTLSISGVAAAAGKAFLAYAIEEVKKRYNESQRPLVVRLSEIDLLLSAVENLDCREEDQARDSLNKAMEETFKRLDTAGDALEYVSLINVLQTALILLEPSASLYTKAMCELLKLTTFETPFWKVSWYDSDWKVRAAAMRAVALIRVVYPDQ